jgi:hypothetical protein
VVVCVCIASDANDPQFAPHTRKSIMTGKR